MFYEHIPTLVIQTIRALYADVYITIDTTLTARLLDFIKINNEATNVKVLLSQISLVLCVVFSLILVFIMVKKRMLTAQPDTATVLVPTTSFAEEPAGVLRDRWNNLLKHLDSTHEAQWKIAVIEADKLVDDSLGKAGYPGDTFGDRLSNIQPGTLLSLDGIWWAHKIRNRLAHEVDYFLRYTEARQAVGYYEAALTELKLI